MKREDVFDYLGITIAGSFDAGPTPPPFRLTINNGEPPIEFPHTDLVKLVWLLNAMGYIWSDIFFFCSHLRMNVDISRRSGDLTIDLYYEIPAPSRDWVVYDYENYRIYDFVNRLTEAEIKHEFDWEEWLFKVKMDWKSTPSPTKREVKMKKRAAGA